MPLILYKDTRFRHASWRIALERDGARLNLPDSGFSRKRDAMPVYERLLAVGDWERFDTWGNEEQSAVWTILRDTSMARQAQAALAKEEEHAHE